MFLLVPAYPGCPGSKAIKRSLYVRIFFIAPMSAVSHHDFYDPVCSRSLNTTRARLKSIRRKMMTKVQMSTISSCTGMCLRRFVVHTRALFGDCFPHKSQPIVS